MNTNSRKLAAGLLVVSVLALLVGVYNAAKLTQTEIQRTEESKSAVSSGLLDKQHLALIDLSGMIVMESSGGSLFGENESNAMSVRKALDAAAEDKSVMGVLLRINSPGGTVGMSQELNAAVKRASLKKPVVASLGDVAASGGYYTACAADKIVANPGTLTGSIGVIINTMNMAELFNKKLGVHSVTIKSGKFKDILSPYREPKPEELALLQKLIDESYADFLGAVTTGRTRFIEDPQEKADLAARIKAVADGRIVPGNQAIAAGLVDELGDQEAAYTLLDQMAKEHFHLKGKERLPLQRDEDHFDLMQTLGLKAATHVPAPQAANDAALLRELMPMSMRFRNQPLWIME